jgi:Protein of unknown function (DUF1203)
MTNSFRIVGLPLKEFSPLFSLTDAELAKKHARRLVVDAKPGFPCRVSLEEAELGERVILLPFAHQPTESPYQASGPVFVREAAQEASLGPAEIPEVVRNRLMSLRAYDKDGIMLAGKVSDGREIKSEIEQLFTDPNISYIHLHNAGAGCYSCRAERV